MEILPPKSAATYWTLDEKGERTAIFWVNFGPKNREPIKIKVNHYRGRIYVDIRYYFFCDKEKVWKPKKEGVNFNMEDFETFEMMFGDICQAVISMKREFVADRAPLQPILKGLTLQHVYLKWEMRRLVVKGIQLICQT